MTERQIKKLQKLLKMKNQEELKKDIKICKEFYINDNYNFQEQAMIIIDSFMDILHLIKIKEFNPTKVIENIEIAFNY